MPWHSIFQFLSNGILLEEGIHMREIGKTVGIRGGAHLASRDSRVSYFVATLGRYIFY
uniref:Uncharacterized protein n=1 Tax=Meloidogyne enterolobii TaxID=390850 RepID=A0A6V7W5E9_MELEN|nr:unnamed protein product [Meloidogyne enterolobii]